MVFSIPAQILSESQSSPILFLSSSPLQIIILFGFYVLVCMAFGILFGYVFSNIFLVIHKSIYKNKLLYGINTRPRAETFNKTLRGIFPTLLALNIALIVAEATQPNQKFIFSTTIILLLFTFGPSVALFAGIWFLDDAGIGYTNKLNVKDTDDFIEFRSIGSWFMPLLKGYAGISVLFEIFQLFNLFTTVQGNVGIVIIILIFFIPVFLPFATIPTILILDIMREKRNKFVLEQARKRGVTKPLDYSLEF
jgi:hypothetical protein